MKRSMLLGLAALLVLGLTASPVLAGGSSCGKGGWGKAAMEDKVLKKIKLIWANQDELKVTDAQMAKIKDIKLKLKKDMIKYTANIDLVKVDVKAKLYDDPVDVAAVNALVDKKYAAKAEKAKASIAAYADLQKVLSAEQKDMLKSLYKHEKGECGCGQGKGMMGGKKCPMMKGPMHEMMKK